MKKKIVGDFRMIREIGRGAFSRVKLAENMKTKEQYAIKIIDKELFTNKDTYRMIRRELNILRSVHHPNLICLHGIMICPKSMYLVLDYASGGALFDRLLDKGPVEENQARKYFQQIIDAIDWMHQHKIIHRDLKPENLLIGSDGALKITDFGLSIVTEHSVEYLKTRCGTPQYVAPEIVQEDVYLGPPADIWSAGLILYVMLAALLPFEGDTVDEVLGNVVNSPLDYPKHFPEGAKNLIEKIVVRDPSDRITIKEIRNDPWFMVDYTPVEIPDRMQNPDTFEITLSDNFMQESAPSMSVFEVVSLISPVECRPLLDSSTDRDVQFSISVNGMTRDLVIDEIKEELQSMSATTQVHNDVMKVVVVIQGKVVSAMIHVVTVFEQLYIVKFTKLKGSANIRDVFERLVRRLKANKKQ